jgi:hypothetical protein
MMMRRTPYWSVLGSSLIVGFTSLDEAAGLRGSLNATLVVLSLMLAAGLEFVQLYHWMALAQVIAGMWLAVSPFILDYAGTGQIGYWHIALGLLLALIGIWHLTQPWKRSATKKQERG